MPKTDEKLIDIAAEIRAARNTASDTTLVSSDWLDDWATRIERAANNLESSFGMALAIEDGLRKRDRERYGNAREMRDALSRTRDLVREIQNGGCISPGAFISIIEDALVAPPRACDVLAKEQLANDIIKAIDECVPGWNKVSDLEKELARAVVNATVNAAYSTNIVKTDEPNDEQHGGAPAPDGAERGANGDTK